MFTKTVLIVKDFIPELSTYIEHTQIIIRFNSTWLIDDLFWVLIKFGFCSFHLTLITKPQ